MDQSCLARLGRRLACLLGLVQLSVAAMAQALPEAPGVMSGEVRASALTTKVVANMEAAIRAGDPEAYLACIDREDPIFFKEQENWAADLKTHTPHECSLELIQSGDGEEAPAMPDGPGATAGESRTFDATLRMKWAWAPEGEPRRYARSIDLPARFVRRGDRWLYAGERWNELGGPGVRVKATVESDVPDDSGALRLGRVLVQYEPELDAVAREVVEVFPEIARHVLTGFGRLEAIDSRDRVQRIKLYTSMKHLQQSIYLSYRDGLGGWNEPGESIKLLVEPFDTRRDLKNVLAHELGHQITFDLGEHANKMPWWVLEGTAELGAARYAGGFERSDAIVRSWAKRDGLLPWSSLVDFRGEAAKHQIHVYVQGAHMMKYITDRFGREGRNAWLAAMAHGAAIDEATQRTFDMGFEELDLAWRSTLPPMDEAK